MKIPFFRISGIIIFILSIIILIFSKNLFLKFFFNTTLLIFLYLFIYYSIIFFKNKKNKIELLTIYDGPIYPLKEINLEIEGKNIFSVFPGIFFQLKFSIYDNNTEIKKNQSNISFIDKNKFQIICNFDRHGEFVLKDFKFVIKDIFGFIKYEISCDLKEQVLVFPYYEGEIEIPFFAENGGDQVIQAVSKINSTDFFENRKYYPGDDTRRINWKIFAHINELHVREIEKIPPKVGEITLYYAPFSKNFYEYEYISSIFFATCYFLLENKFELKILSPISDKFYHIKEENEKDFNLIINYSYKTITGKLLNELDNPVIFASFDEFNKLINKNLLKDCFCAVSFFNNEENKNSLLKSIIKIEQFDNLVIEFLSKFNSIKAQKSKEILLKEHENFSLKNKIDLKIFRVKNEQFNKK